MGASNETDRLLQAPPLKISRWFNTREQALSLEALRGRVVAIDVFQMLCPGCVSHSIPQAQKLQRLFSDKDLVVLGLHSVFEHHQAMQPHALEAFLHEYKITFPVGVDAPGEGNDPLPQTMRAYGMRGTPTLLLFDQKGRLRSHYFGRVEDLALGAEIGALIAAGELGLEPEASPAEEEEAGGKCDDRGCSI